MIKVSKSTYGEGFTIIKGDTENEANLELYSRVFAVRTAGANIILDPLIPMPGFHFMEDYHNIAFGTKAEAEASVSAAFNAMQQLASPSDLIQP